MFAKDKSAKSIRPATMRDVARLAGVSQPTVSRVLNQTVTDISISDETVSRVLAAVKELDYRPNVLARSLRTQKTQMIALMVADITNPFYHPIARAVHDVAREHSYDVLIADTDHRYENEVHFFEAITRRPVDGVIIVPIHLSMQEIGDFIERTGTPVAVLGPHVHHPTIDVVSADDAQAVHDMTAWLVHERGYRSFGYITVPDDMPPGPRRFRGFERALSAAGLSVESKHIAVGDFTLEGGRRATRDLIARGSLPKALVVANDLMAIGAILTLQEAGYRVPEDVAVVGYDNIPEAEIVRPALTTVLHDARDIGHKLGQLMFERLENPSLPTRRVSSPCGLIIRDSA